MCLVHALCTRLYFHRASLCQSVCRWQLVEELWYIRAQRRWSKEGKRHQTADRKMRRGSFNPSIAIFCYLHFPFFAVLLFVLCSPVSSLPAGTFSQWFIFNRHHTVNVYTSRSQGPVVVASRRSEPLGAIFQIWWNGAKPYRPYKPSSQRPFSPQSSLLPASFRTDLDFQLTDRWLLHLPSSGGVVVNECTGVE